MQPNFESIKAAKRSSQTRHQNIDNPDPSQSSMNIGRPQCLGTPWRNSSAGLRYCACVCTYTHKCLYTCMHIYVHMSVHFSAQRLCTHMYAWFALSLVPVHISVHISICMPISISRHMSMHMAMYFLSDALFNAQVDTHVCTRTHGPVGKSEAPHNEG